MPRNYDRLTIDAIGPLGDLDSAACDVRRLVGTIGKSIGLGDECRGALEELERVLEHARRIVSLELRRI